jgi:hypothetical protein
VCKKPINMYPEKCMVRSSVVNFKWKLERRKHGPGTAQMKNRVRERNSFPLYCKVSPLPAIDRTFHSMLWYPVWK